MNRSTPASRANAPHAAPNELRDLESAARRLLTEHARDPLTTLAIIVDLEVRRLAHRVVARLRTPDRGPICVTRRTR